MYAITCPDMSPTLSASSSSSSSSASSISLPPTQQNFQKTQHTRHSKHRRHRKDNTNNKAQNYYDVLAGRQLPSPPLSPVVSPNKHSNNKACADDRLKAARRDNQLRTVLTELHAVKRQGLALTTASYNIVLEAYMSLRRDGTPLTQMLQRK